MSPNKTASFNRQYSALQLDGGAVELAGWSSVALRGADRQTFLNNFCTNDVKRLAPGENCETFFCNVKGRVIGHGLVMCRADDLVFIGPAGQGANLVAHLDRYVIREDVQILDTTADTSYVLISGGSSLREVEAELNGHFWPLIDAPVAYVLESSPAETSRLRALLDGRGWPVCEPGVFETLRIEAGTPLFGVDFDDRNFPQEVGRNQQAISFTKGCYLGQETVARIDALGHVNQQIVGVAFSDETMAAIGLDLLSRGASIGRVTSATFSPSLGRPLALAMVRRDHALEGAKLESAVGPCEVVALPVTHRRAAT